MSDYSVLLKHSKHKTEKLFSEHLNIQVLSISERQIRQLLGKKVDAMPLTLSHKQRKKTSLLGQNSDE